MSDDIKTAKKKLVSLKFLFFAILLGIAAYFAGPTIMTQIMYIQENAKTSGPAIIPEMSSESAGTAPEKSVSELGQGSMGGQPQGEDSKE